MQQLMVLLPEAVREINAKMEQLRLSVPASDIPAISLNAHTIKSVAASIGAKAVRLAAECIELAATKRQPEECAELFPALELEIGRLAEAVSDLP